MISYLTGNLVALGTLLVFVGGVGSMLAYFKIAQLGNSTNEQDYRVGLVQTAQKWAMLVVAGLFVSFIGTFL